jgi:hypothetical protein
MPKSKAKSKPRLTQFERWVGWLFSTPRGQFAYCLGCVGLLALCAWADGLAREHGRSSMLAANRDEFWNGIELGAAFGWVTVVAGYGHWALCLLLSPRGAPRDWEPTGWRRWVLYVSFGFHLLVVMAVVMALLRWSFRSGTFPFSLFPPYFAMGAVAALAFLLRRAMFGSGPEDGTAEQALTEK